MANPIDLLGIGAKLIDTVAGFIPNPEEKQKAALAIQAQMQEAQIALEQSQLDINKAEAASPSMFVGGWRPYVGWIAGTALAINYLLFPVMTYAVAILAAHYHTKLPELPTIDMTLLMPLLLAMLGLRTYEKSQGVQTNSTS